jgi:malonate-semialdehyde dehydrogenase (acetylating)/methylmalonate-semialdehyde dehydrogenase
MTDMHFIKGATSAGTSGRSQNVYNPATGAVTSSVPLASAAEIDAAVAVAKAPCQVGPIRRRQNALKSCSNSVN